MFLLSEFCNELANPILVLLHCCNQGEGEASKRHGGGEDSSWSGGGGADRLHRGGERSSRRNDGSPARAMEPLGASKRESEGVESSGEGWASTAHLGEEQGGMKGEIKLVVPPSLHTASTGAASHAGGHGEGASQQAGGYLPQIARPGPPTIAATAADLETPASPPQPLPPPPLDVQRLQLVCTLPAALLVTESMRRWAGPTDCLRRKG